MTDAAPVVFVIDDDASVRRALGRLLRSAGLRAEAFASAQDFLGRERPDSPGCLVLDVEMPGLDGLELQRALIARGSRLPVVFLTGHGDIPMSVRAMKAGAVDFLTKPCRDDALLGAVRQAVAADVEGRRGQDDLAALRRCVAGLTPREHEVFALVAAGRLNKQIAHRLGVCLKTVKAHRGQVMRKTGAGSVADLVRMAGKLGIPVPAE